jgi:ferredoxin
VAAGQTLLQALREHQLEPPFSCQAGVCGACRASLTSGNVHMRSRVALEDEDIDRGAILTCQSVARSEELSVVFDAG